MDRYSFDRTTLAFATSRRVSVLAHRLLALRHVTPDEGAAASVAQSFASQKLCGFSRVIIRFVSRLRRIVLSDHYFFGTCCLRRGRRFLAEDEFRILSRVIGERRRVHGFILTAWVLLPDHWHAVVDPRHPLTISDVVEAIKVSATRRMNVGRETLGPLFQSVRSAQDKSMIAPSEQWKNTAKVSSTFTGTRGGAVT